ncbi:MAG TPA: MFS transporter, partial [Chitinophagaceae bacterium]|nr:MFS transporter [Chitinophagaceae bacterium]
QMPPRAHFTIVLIAVWMVALFVYRWALPDKPTVNKGDKLFVLPDKALLGLGIMAFCCLICEGTMFDWSGVYFKKVVAAPTAWVPLGYVAFMCCMSLGRFISDSLVTRWGAITILKVSGLLIVAGLLLSVVFPNIVVASIGFMLVGFGVSSVVPLVYALAGKSKHMPPGLALTAVSTIGNFGFLLGPPLIGFIAQAASLRWSFVLIAILGCFVALLAKRTDR